MTNLGKNLKTTSLLIKGDEFNQAVRNLNTQTFNDFDINENWFFIDLGNEFYIKIDDNGKYVLEFTDERVCPLSKQQTQIVNSWVSEKEKEALESEAYACDIIETEEYLNTASRSW
ncbi:hypothetical protein BAS10_07445 [Elizabethkingia meningoseptica]|uniref:hypothetical protein n=1 Tax=Elizabethkingia meningoseptica TaxID=238 RepID=UPI00099AB559|nr:hypothetical protein [Elizabethkingia meningoseptica]OPB96875.1 hypothetical protein BAS10_07445 [Elizabethkingia meningoseptica]